MDKATLFIVVVIGLFVFVAWVKGEPERSRKDMLARYSRIAVNAQFSDDRCAYLIDYATKENADWRMLEQHRPDIFKQLVAYRSRIEAKEQVVRDAQAAREQARAIAAENERKRQRESVMSAQATAWRTHGIEVGMDGTHCIYMLFRGSTVVYVGRTDSMHNRLQQHLESKAGLFDTVRQYVVPSRHARQIEAALIRHINPKLNQKYESPGSARHDHVYIHAFNTHEWSAVDALK